RRNRRGGGMPSTKWTLTSDCPGQMQAPRCRFPHRAREGGSRTAAGRRQCPISGRTHSNEGAVHDCRWRGACLCGNSLLRKPARTSRGDLEGPMKYTRLGSTGLEVSRLCFGCMSYGTPNEQRPWILREDEARPLLRAGYEAGINFFDTANTYAGGTSEEIVGNVLTELAPREELVIA